MLGAEAQYSESVAGALFPLSHPSSLLCPFSYDIPSSYPVTKDHSFWWGLREENISSCHCDRH